MPSKYIEHRYCAKEANWTIYAMTPAQLGELGKHSCNEHLHLMMDGDTFRVTRSPPGLLLFCTYTLPPKSFPISIRIGAIASEDGVLIYESMSFVRRLTVQLDWVEAAILRDFIDSRMLTPDPPPERSPSREGG